MKRVARFLAATLVAAGLLAPSATSAATKHRAHSHEAGPSYPMKAEDFRELMDKRIDRVRAAIDKKLDRRGVSADRKKAIHKIFDEASKDLRAEIARATADGTVTESEGDKVKALAVALRAKVRERLRAEKDPALKERLAKEEAAQKAKTDKQAAEKKAAEKKGSEKKGSEKKASEKAEKVAKTETPKPKSGSTKATKSTKAKKPGETKTAKAQPKEKPPSEGAGEDL
jgi:hypothetical protein